MKKFVNVNELLTKLDELTSTMNVRINCGYSLRDCVEVVMRSMSEGVVRCKDCGYSDVLEDGSLACRVWSDFYNGQYHEHTQVVGEYGYCNFGEPRFGCAGVSCVEGSSSDMVSRSELASKFGINLNRDCLSCQWATEDMRCELGVRFCDTLMGGEGR